MGWGRGRGRGGTGRAALMRIVLVYMNVKQCKLIGNMFLKSPFADNILHFLMQIKLAMHCNVKALGMMPCKATLLKLV